MKLRFWRRKFVWVYQIRLFLAGHREKWLLESRSEGCSRIVWGDVRYFCYRGQERAVSNIFDVQWILFKSAIGNNNWTNFSRDWLLLNRRRLELGMLNPSSLLCIRGQLWSMVCRNWTNHWLDAIEPMTCCLWKKKMQAINYETPMSRILFI